MIKTKRSIKRTQVNEFFLRVKVFLENICKLIRWDEWNISKLSLIFLVFYYLTFTVSAKGWYIIAIFFNLVGYFCVYMAFGYVINDYSDRAIDKVVGKKKLQFEIPSSRIKLLLFGLCLGGVMISFPLWQKNYMVLSLIIVMYMLAMFYSIPPIRFKERKWLSPIIASLTQRTFPILLCFAIFRQFETDTILFALLSLIIGVRWLIVHQIKDYNNDVAANVKTLVVNWGIIKGRKYLFTYVIPLEIALLGITILYLCLYIPIFILFIVCYFILMLLLRSRFSREWLFTSVILNESFLSNFYFLFLPLVFATLSSLSSPILLILVIFHLIWNRRLIHENIENFRIPPIILNKQAICDNSCSNPIGNSWQASLTPFYTEWWYFDALFDDGSFFGGSFSLHGYLDLPETVEAKVEFTLNLANGHKTQISKSYPYSHFSFREKPFQLVIGNNRIEDKKPNLYLHLEENNIEIDLNYCGIVKGFQVGTDGKLFFLKDWERYFGWAVPYPMADINGRIRIEEKFHQVRGEGYQDHNWASISLEDNISHWHWLRLPMNNNKVLILAELVLRTMNKKPILFIGLRENNKWLLFRCLQTDHFAISFRPCSKFFKEDRKIGISYRLYWRENDFLVNIQLQTEAILKSTLRPKKTISLFPYTPCCIRFLSSAKGELVID
ncbi:UbiA family prenyltransferase, partial [Thermodesulfovibrionales bacterium]|nr:UbiA family prenyltransferase [Thermodesulfovibrionales bacterium]